MSRTRRRHYRPPERVTRARAPARVQRAHRGRLARGRCGKRQWRDLEEAVSAVMRALAHPENPVDRVAIYVCRDCGWYHQSRSTGGRNVVRVIERERGGS